MRLLISGSWVRAPRWARSLNNIPKKCASLPTNTEWPERARVVLATFFKPVTSVCNWKSPLMGFEPTTSELEVQRASPLRHSGCQDVALPYISPTWYDTICLEYDNAIHQMAYDTRFLRRTKTTHPLAHSVHGNGDQWQQLHGVSSVRLWSCLRVC